jgi:hypothetical protein
MKQEKMAKLKSAKDYRETLLDEARGIAVFNHKIRGISMC